VNLPDVCSLYFGAAAAVDDLETGDGAVRVLGFFHGHREGSVAEGAGDALAED
jgi:hypothetical protein